MNAHVVSYQQSGHPEGMIAILLAHPNGEVYWNEDGSTCYPDVRCDAIAEVSNELCGKREAVVLLLARAMYARVDNLNHEIALCGGHFGSHRAGKKIRVVVTPGKAR